MSEITMEKVVGGLEALATQMSEIAKGLNEVMKIQKEENHDDVLLDMLRREKQVNDIVTLCDNVEQALLAADSDSLVDYDKMEFVVDFDRKIHVHGEHWLNKKVIANIVRAEVIKVFEQQNGVIVDEGVAEQEFLVGKNPEYAANTLDDLSPDVQYPKFEEVPEEEFHVGKNPEYMGMMGLISSQPSESEPKHSGTIHGDYSAISEQPKLFPYDPDAELNAQNNV